jgi:hypothetical protein
VWNDKGVIATLSPQRNRLIVLVVFFGCFFGLGRGWGTWLDHSGIRGDATRGDGDARWPER